MSATKTAPRPVEPGAPPPVIEESGMSRWIPALGVIAVWIVVYSFTKGENTSPCRVVSTPSSTRR